MSYGEMAAEIERVEEAPVEKSAPEPAREKSPSEEETVVLGGDSPISFDKALGLHGEGPKEAKKEAFKYDRRDLQRAALDERERLRALFESAKPEDDESEDGPRRPVMKPRAMAPSASAVAGAARAVPTGAPRPRWRQHLQRMALPRRPRTSLSLNLLGPHRIWWPACSRPARGPGSADPLWSVAPLPPQPSKPKRTPRAKVTSIPEPAPIPLPTALQEAAPEPITPGKKKPAPKAKPSKAVSDKDKEKGPKAPKEASGPKATRAKKAKI